jgi:hypothetical protein
LNVFSAYATLKWFNYICIGTAKYNMVYTFGDITIAGEGLQNSGLCSALKAFEQGSVV